MRIIAWLTLANTHLHGIKDFADGLKLTLALCEQYWDAIHPRIEVDGDSDSYMRMNAIAAFSESITVLRRTTLVKLPLALTFRDIELAFNKAPEVAYGLAQIEPILTNALVANSAELAAVTEAYTSYQALCKLVDDRVDATETPDMGRLTDVLKPVARGLERLLAAATGDSTDDTSAQSGDAAVGDGASASGSGGSSAVQNREDVHRALERVCAYLERHEPSNPASLFARRAQRMLSMQFLDIMRELSPDSVSHLETLTGKQAEP